MMRRRSLITLLGGAAAAWPLAGWAQSPRKLWRIGAISGGTRARIPEFVAAFPQGMQELGYVEGHDFSMEWRFAEGNYERIHGFAAELMQLNVDVFLLTTAAAILPV